MQKADGMNYAPTSLPRPVCKQGEFRFAAIGLDHGHIYGMTNGLCEAGAELALVYDPDPAKIAAFVKTYPGVNVAPSEQAVLEDASIRLVASAAIPCDRAALGLRVLAHEKDYFVDKPPLTSFEQLAAAREKVRETGKKYAVYYSERLHVEAAMHAGRLLEDGAIGRVLSVIGFGPHRMNAKNRPEWFWDKRRFGGIITDIGSHQIEQFLFWSGAKSARLLHSKVANYRGEHPDFEDYGDATFVADTGATHFMRVDWYTPDGLSAWGDGRTFITGSEGTIELRKYLDVARDPTSDHVYLVNREGEFHIPVRGKVGFPFFGELILDCLERTERAMTQEHAFLAIELALEAQAQAIRVA
ncbi:MAG TPA: Gfo/Idh/MocA family oxidoreductase [Polyangiaceae bacterium]|nr:Gfo/Idh/MocA family oxidoreductase [Polyangiaceae bacterium]